MTRRLLALTVALLGTLALTASSPGPEDPQWTRLRSMPLEQRQRLAARLKTFDSLPAADQEAVRQLDRQIAGETPDDRENDYLLLRRYHLWLHGLSDTQRKEVIAAAPDRRMAVVTRIMEAQRAAQTSPPFVRRLSEFGGHSPFDMAYAIKVWLKLSLAEREEVLRLPEASRRQRLNSFGDQLKVKRLSHPTQADAETLYGEADRKYHLPPFPPKPSGVGKFAQEEKQRMDERQRRFRLNVAEYYKLETTPLKKKVTPEHLYQFDREVPAWLRQGFEDVSADDARWLLSRLYRLVFPNDEEIPLSKTSAASTAAKPAGKSAAPAPAKPPLPVPASKKSSEPPHAPKPGTDGNPF